MEHSENSQTEPNDDLAYDELEMLKKRARLIGVEFSNNIGLETLKERVAAKLGAEDDTSNEGESSEEEESKENPLASAAPAKGKSAKKKTLRQHLHDQNMRLVRVRVSCMDPKKNDLPGEIFTVANEFLGTVRKFVPFGEATDDGYHIPYCIYKMMQARQFLQITTRKDKVTKQLVVNSRYVREFSIEILPEMTAEELRKLAMEQSATGRIG